MIKRMQHIVHHAKLWQCSTIVSTDDDVFLPVPMITRFPLNGSLRAHGGGGCGAGDDESPQSHRRMCCRAQCQGFFRTIITRQYLLQPYYLMADVASCMFANILLFFVVVYVVLLSATIAETEAVPELPFGYHRQQECNHCCSQVYYVDGIRSMLSTAVAAAGSNSRQCERCQWHG